MTFAVWSGTKRNESGAQGIFIASRHSAGPALLYVLFSFHGS